MEQSTYLYVKLTRTVANYLKQVGKEHLAVTYSSNWIYYIQVKLQNNYLVGLALFSSISVNLQSATIISALKFKQILFDWSMNQ